MKEKKHHKLNQFFATAISGNDILSSALYVSGIAVLFAGIYAPLVLAFIGLVLYFYKAVYTEVVEALPINGGAYNGLLNGTSKTIAALAGVTTILSYVATAVISAKTGVEYLHTVVTAIPVIPATIAIICLFAILVVSGLKDSANVAGAIFVFHILTLVTFVAVGAIFYLNGHTEFSFNLHQTGALLAGHGGPWKALYLAFSASLLGVSGFESSANFVEEQDIGVFRKTLRNMLIGIAIFNPLIALIALNAAPLDIIINSKDFLLADLAHLMGGTWFQYMIVIDAFLVLSGAVLTSFVGVSGLAFRMAADACLPVALTKTNKSGSFPRIIVTFAALCISILLLTKGNLLTLAGVYTIAFLSVMSLFAFGALILRETRSELKRTYYAPIPFILMALVATLIGITGNIRIDVNNLRYFEVYFIPAVFFVLCIINKKRIVESMLRVSKPIPFLHKYLKRKLVNFTSDAMLVFVHHIGRVYEILEYIKRNETSRNITFIHCNGGNKGVYGDSYTQLEHIIPELQIAGAFTDFNIKTKYSSEPFSPETVEKIAKKHKVPHNRVLIGSIHHSHKFDYADFGGVRIVI